MKMLKVMEKRRSTRVYDQAPLDESVMTAIQKVIDSMPVFTGNESVSFEIIENGDTAFEALNGIVGYNGLTIQAPHYFLITCSGVSEDYPVVGYLGEWLALHLAKEEVGTCWLTCTGKTEAIASALGMTIDGQVAAMMAFGRPNEDKKLSRIYGIGQAPVNNPGEDASEETMVKDENYAYKKAITEIVYLKTFGNEVEADEIAKRGMDEIFYYMRNAPSWGNLQPWKFILDGERVVLTMAKNPEIDEEVQRIDSGVAMLYFEVAMRDRGLSGKWYMDTTGIAEKCQVATDYNVAAYYSY